MLGNGFVVLFSLLSTLSTLRFCFRTFASLFERGSGYPKMLRGLTSLFWQTARGIVSKEIPGFPMKVGEEFKMMGCSLFWWVGTGEDAKGWKIRKEVEYSKMLI